MVNLVTLEVKDPSGLKGNYRNLGESGGWVIKISKN